MAKVTEFQRLRRITRLLHLIADGEALNAACKATGIHRRSFYRWIAKSRSLEERYRVACEHRAVTVAEGVLKIINEAPAMITETKGEVTTTRIDPGWANAMRTKLEGARWFSSVTHPRKYGKSLEVSADINVNDGMTPEQRDLDLARRMAFSLSLGANALPRENTPPPAIKHYPTIDVTPEAKAEAPRYALVPYEERALRRIEDKAHAIGNERDTAYDTGRKPLTSALS